MSRRLAATAVAAACVLNALTGAGTAAAQPADNSRSWLVLGDSYSSGEGIQNTATPSTDQLPRSGERVRDCRRADGRNGNATSWAPEAHRLVGAELNVPELDFAACTGAIADEIPAQIDEAGTGKWDLVTFSIGGNNIKFADIIKECIDLPPSFSDLRKRKVGCKIDEAQFKHRVDLLAGDAGIEPGEYTGTTALPEIYDKVAERVKSGGHVVVLGYPNIVEETRNWRPLRTPIGGIELNRNRCEWIWRKDVQLLRTGAAYLNRRIEDAVLAADQRHESEGIRFHFLDIASNPYERDMAPDDRHSLCTDDQWLHSVKVTRKLYSGMSFHPNQRGYTATGRLLADYLRENVRFTDPPQPCPSVGLTPNSDDVAFDIISAGVACEDVEDMMREVRAGDGFGDRFTVNGFDCVVTGESSDGMILRLFRCTKASRWFTFSHY